MSGWMHKWTGRAGWTGPDAARRAAQALAWGMRWWYRNCHYRVAHYDASYDPGDPSYSRRSVIVFWHEFAAALLPHWERVELSLLISQHRDGELLNELARSMGYRSIRGSSTRGGAAAVRQMRKLGPRESIGIAPDGPRGPRRELALGPIYVASLLRVPIIPVGVGLSGAWRLNTWDRFAIPHPFSRVRVVFGPPLWVPRQLPREALESFRNATETVLERMNELATGWSVRQYQLGDATGHKQGLAAGLVEQCLGGTRFAINDFQPHPPIDDDQHCAA